jgi:hypothetical protein
LARLGKKAVMVVHRIKLRSKRIHAHNRGTERDLASVLEQ